MMNKVFPDRPIVDIPNPDPIFHTVYDLDDRYQVPGMQYSEPHSVCEKCRTNPRWGRAAKPRWRGIYDDQRPADGGHLPRHGLGRFLGERRRPEYPQKFSALGIRIGVNYLIYSMTH